MTVSAGPLQQEFILVNISCRNGKLQQFEKKKGVMMMREFIKVIQKEACKIKWPVRCSHF
jgi:hypothetical protein